MSATVPPVKRQVGDTVRSVQHRCPRMREHLVNCPTLNIPCPDCYSVVVTSTVIPWRKPEGWS